MQVASDPAQKITMEDITTIFYMMDQIYQKHKEFVDSLKVKVEHWSDEQTIGESFKIMVCFISTLSCMCLAVFEPHHEKLVLLHMGPVMAWISLLIHAEPQLSV